jgi:hypothetical protein
MQQDIGLAAIQIRTGEEIRAHHLKTVAARFVAAEHHGCGLGRLLDDRNLALVNLENKSVRAVHNHARSAPAATESQANRIQPRAAVVLAEDC